jgi:acetyl-CoA/propionyl-CoA carboxylase biotin carboxyl carrier protein
MDSGVEAGSEITPMYDPMVAKLIVWDADREQATRRMLRALSEYEIEGLKTLIPFHQAIMASEQWANAQTCRDLIEDREWLKTLAFEKVAAAEDESEEKVQQTYTVEVSGRRFDVKVIGAPPAYAAAANGSANGKKPARSARAASRGGGASGDTLASPMQGNIFKVLVEQGQTVQEGALIAIIEAMKMENEITAHKAGVVAELPINVGDAVTSGATLAVIKDAEAPAE